MNQISTTSKLQKLAKIANDAADEARAHAGAAVEQAIKSGSALNNAKEQVLYGQWNVWLDENFDYSVRTATRFMKLAGADPSVIGDSDSIRKALIAVHDSEPVRTSKPDTGELRTRASEAKPDEKPEPATAPTKVIGTIVDDPIADMADEEPTEAYEDVEEAEESPPAKPRASIVRDGLGRDVPESLRDVQTTTLIGGAIGRLIDKCKREVTDKLVDEHWPLLSLQEIEIDFHSIKRKFVNAAYWTACPRCDGDGCEKCRGNGFLAYSDQGGLSKADKEALGL